MKLKNGRPLEDFGCSYSEYMELRGLPGNPIRSFSQHRSNAKHRGVGWDLTLMQWWSIWQESGHWERRGCGTHAYCMCRKGGVGSYAVGNVFIALFTQNSSVHTLKKSLLPTGVSIHGGRFRARRRINRKLVDLGYFTTAELAGAAYLASLQREAAAAATDPTDPAGVNSVSVESFQQLQATETVTATKPRRHERIVVTDISAEAF